MKNLTDSQIVERKIASLSPETQAKWKSETLGLYAREIREEVQLNWIKEHRQEEALGQYKINESENRDEQTGLEIAKILCLQRDDDHKDRFVTEFGSKTAIGIFRTVKRIIEERAK